MHGAHLHYKRGTMRRWIEEVNKGVEIQGIRWLLKENRPGKSVIPGNILFHNRQSQLLYPFTLASSPGGGPDSRMAVARSKCTWGRGRGQGQRKQLVVVKYPQSFSPLAVDSPPCAWARLNPVEFRLGLDRSHHVRTVTAGT